MCFVPVKHCISENGNTESDRPQLERPVGVDPALNRRHKVAIESHILYVLCYEPVFVPIKKLMLKTAEEYVH